MRAMAKCHIPTDSDILACEEIVTKLSSEQLSVSQIRDLFFVSESVNDDSTSSENDLDIEVFPVSPAESEPSKLLERRPSSRGREVIFQLSQLSLFVAFAMIVN
jgi:hypothetical protein